MLVALSDTHGDTDPQLTAHLDSVLVEAEQVVHAGDFITTAVLEAFERQVQESGGRFTAVHGNADTVTVTERLPAMATLTWAGQQVLVVHGHEHDTTSLSFLAREREADLVVVGHTHRQAVDQAGAATVMNPGSHADPRGGQAGYAVCREVGSGVRCELRGVQGDTIRAVLL